MQPTVVGLVAWCDLADDSGEPGLSFDVHELAVLSDGTRVTLHTDLGLNTWLRSTDGSELDQWAYRTVETLSDDVLTVVQPDDDEPTEAHPWEWLADLARQQGLEVGAEELKGLPYTVELSARVLEHLPPP